MIYIIIFTILTLVSFAKVRDDDNWYLGVFLNSSTVGMLVLVGLINNFSTEAFVHGHEALRASYQNASQNPDALISATFYTDIAESNATLARYQFANSTFNWDYANSDLVDTVGPIE